VRPAVTGHTLNNSLTSSRRAGCGEGKGGVRRVVVLAMAYLLDSQAPGKHTRFKAERVPQAQHREARGECGPWAAQADYLECVPRQDSGSLLPHRMVLASTTLRQLLALLPG